VLHRCGQAAPDFSIVLVGKAYGVSMAAMVGGSKGIHLTVPAVRDNNMTAQPEGNK